MKVAVIRFSSLGDVALSSAVLQPLYEKGYSITFITFSPFGQLFKKDYRLEKLIEIDKKQLKSLSDIRQFSKQLKDFDVIIDLHSNFRTFLISKFSGVKTVKYDKKSLQRRLLTKPLLKNFVNLKKFNVLDAYLKPLEELGIESKGTTRKALEKVKNLQYVIDKDEIFNGNYKIVLEFDLNKGAYATSFLNSFLTSLSTSKALSLCHMFLPKIMPLEFLNTSLATLKKFFSFLPPAKNT